MSKERSSTEKITSVSKKVDIATGIYGLIIGGQAGFAIVLLSGATYWAADRIEKKSKAS